MKLKINQIQALEFLLKRLNSTFFYTSNNETLHLVIKFNNSLWKGDFILYQGSTLSDYYIDLDNCIEYKTLSIREIFNSSSNFQHNRYRNIKFDKIYLMLPELIATIQKSDLSNFNLKPILYNATNLESNFKLPFILFNNNDELEVVSVITSSKDE